MQMISFMWIMNLERCNRIRRKLSENFYVNFSCWTYWFLLIVYFSYLGFGAWMFVILERPTEEDKCEFVNEFGALYVNAGEEYVWSKLVYLNHLTGLMHDWLGTSETSVIWSIWTRMTTFRSVTLIITTDSTSLTSKSTCVIMTHIKI